MSPTKKRNRKANEDNTYKATKTFPIKVMTSDLVLDYILKLISPITSQYMFY